MKLLLCKSCQDVVRLIDEKRVCRCGKTGGIYVDDLNAKYFGNDAVPIGFANSSLHQAIINQPIGGHGKEFIAFVIPKNCSTLVKVEKEDL